MRLGRGLRSARIGHPVGVEHRRKFPQSTEAVRDARAYVRKSLSDRADPSVLDDVELVVSELATNAVIHARSPFEVVIASDGRVRVDVLDRSPTVPTKRPAPPPATSGRGLWIVEALCDRWGIRTDHRGKSVWCEKDLS
jgi:anti-sigma regulatory factor (Ser/Thr protein kinase)